MDAEKKAGPAFAGLKSYDGSDEQGSPSLGPFIDGISQDATQPTADNINRSAAASSATADIKTLDEFSSRNSNSDSSVQSDVRSKSRRKKSGSGSDANSNNNNTNTNTNTDSSGNPLASFRSDAAVASDAASTVGPSSNPTASATPSSSSATGAAGFFPPDPNSAWPFYQNLPGGFENFPPNNVYPGGFYNPQFQFAQQWPMNVAPQFTGELPQRPRLDPQQDQQGQPQDQQQQQQQPPQQGDPTQHRQPGQSPQDLLLQQQQQQQELLFRLQQQNFLQHLQQQPGAFPAAASHVRPNLPPEVLNALTPAQQEKLKSIAMPAHLQYHSPMSEPSPQSSAGGGIPSSPDANDPTKANGRKRKSSADEDDDDDDDDDDMPQPIKKTAHNMIEKRYRTNLNDKIAALRDSVPSLRIMTKSARGEDTTEDREELHGLTPAHKLNKATVLSKATEYIRHLEKRNNRLQDENGQMLQRIAAFEKLFMHGALSTANPMSPMAQPTPMAMPFVSGQPDPATMAAFMGTTPMGTPRGPDPAGMIPVPEDMKRILQAQAATGRPYPVPQQPFQPTPALIRQQQLQQQQQMQQNRWQATAPYLGKMMVGSLAGLMILEAAREQEINPEKPEGRGLFAVPLQILRPLVVSDTHISIGGYYLSVAQLFANLKLLLLFGILLWAFVPSLFRAPKPKQEKTQQASNASPQAAPSLASPIHIRRRAWLTAIQTVWVPRHNFFLEAAALVIKMLKLSMRNLLGMHNYQMLTGLTQEEETARVKAWGIALDAQLAGGDVEINESRLALTLLASHTLPESPLRLMLNALHIRVLVRHVAKSNTVLDTLAAHMARNKWNAAREQNMLATKLRRGSTESGSSGGSNNKSDAGSGSASPIIANAPWLQADDELPSHLATLLAEECDDVLNDAVVQRAYNLAFNHPTTFAVPSDVVDIDGMNAVVEDPAVRSPMDAVAAWYSSLLVHHMLADSLAMAADADSEEQALAKSQAATSTTSTVTQLDLAARIAPVGSHAQVRALVARAVLVDDKRAASIAVALQALRPALNPDKHPQYSHGQPPLIDAPLSPPVAPDRDALMALRCAMALAHLQRFDAVPPQDILAPVDAILRRTSPRSQEEANDEDGAALAAPFSASSVSLLACAAAFRLMLALHTHKVAAEACAPSLEQLSGALRVWVGGPAGDHGGLDAAVRHSMVRRCLTVTRSVVGMDHDTGYGSMSESESGSE